MKWINILFTKLLCIVSEFTSPTTCIKLEYLPIFRLLARSALFSAVAQKSCLQVFALPSSLDHLASKLEFVQRLEAFFLFFATLGFILP